MTFNILVESIQMSCSKSSLNVNEEVNCMVSVEFGCPSVLVEVSYGDGLNDYFVQRGNNKLFQDLKSNLKINLS